MPENNSTNYWIASRSVSCDSNRVFYFIMDIRGYLNVYNLYFSNNSSSWSTKSIFPIVSLSYDKLEQSATLGTYNMK